MQIELDEEQIYMLEKLADDAAANYGERIRKFCELAFVPNHQKIDGMQDTLNAEFSELMRASTIMRDIRNKLENARKQKQGDDSNG